MTFNEIKKSRKMENENNNKNKNVGAQSLFNTVNLEINAFDLLELQYILEYARERMEQDKEMHFYDLKKIASLYARCEELCKNYK